MYYIVFTQTLQVECHDRIAMLRDEISVTDTDKRVPRDAITNKERYYLAHTIYL